MRVTGIQLFRSKLMHMQQAARQHFNAVRIAGSGVRLERPSDDPVDVQRSMLVRAAKADVELARDKAARVTDEMLLMDQSLGGMETAISRLREIAVQMSSDIMTPEARLNAATEVNNIKDTIISLGNVNFGDRHLFGGRQTGADPFDAAGNYNGDSVEVQVNIGDDLTVSTTLAGDELLRGAAGGPDIIQEIDNFITALGTNFIVGINQAIDGMDESFGHVSDFRSIVGSRMRVTEMFDVHLADIEVTMAKDLSDLEDADILEAFSEMTRAQQAYESAMQVTVAARTPNIFGMI